MLNFAVFFHLCACPFLWVYLQGNDVSENTEGLSKEELGRLVASRWTGENTGKQSAEADAVLDNEDQEDIPKETNNEEHDGYASDTDDDSHKYEEDEIDEDFREDEHDDHSSSYKSDTDTEPYFSGLLLLSMQICYLGLVYSWTCDEMIQMNSDDTTTDNPSWLEKIQKTVRGIFQAVNLFQTPVNQSGTH